jgi:hypothetical protein
MLAGCGLPWTEGVVVCTLRVEDYAPYALDDCTEEVDVEANCVTISMKRIDWGGLGVLTPRYSDTGIAFVTRGEIGVIMVVVVGMARMRPTLYRGRRHEVRWCGRCGGSPKRSRQVRTSVAAGVCVGDAVLDQERMGAVRGELHDVLSACSCTRPSQTNTAES